jgi:hypothetical protein
MIRNNCHFTIKVLDFVHIVDIDNKLSNRKSTPKSLGH